MIIHDHDDDNDDGDGGDNDDDDEEEEKEEHDDDDNDIRIIIFITMSLVIGVLIPRPFFSTNEIKAPHGKKPQYLLSMGSMPNDQITILHAEVPLSLNVRARFVDC